MKYWLSCLAAVFLGGICGTAQGWTSVETGKTPREVVEQLWRMATSGELLTPTGQDRAARSFTDNPIPAIGSKLMPASAHPIKKVVVVSNDWSVDAFKVSGDSAEVLVEYYDAGEIDSVLRYSPPKPNTNSMGKSMLLFKLTLAPTCSVNFRSEAGNLVVDKIVPGPSAWQIQGPQGPPFATVNTAIRYVLERQEKTTDPVIRKNASVTLHQLLKFQ